MNKWYVILIIAVVVIIVSYFLVKRNQKMKNLEVYKQCLNGLTAGKTSNSTCGNIKKSLKEYYNLTDTEINEYVNK